MSSIFLSFEEATSLIYDEINKSDIKLSEAITSFMESTENLKYVTESERGSLIGAVKKFFANIISAIRKFFVEIKNRIRGDVRYLKTDITMHKTYKQLLEKKEAGVNIVKVYDVWSLEKAYSEAVGKLTSTAKRLSKMKYKSTDELDADLDQFNILYDKYEDAINILSDKKIYVPIDKMIKFVGDEISDRSHILDLIDECTESLEKMRDDVDIIEQRYDILHADIIPRHMSLIKRIATSISSFIHKWVSKFISKFVFIVG